MTNKPRFYKLRSLRSLKILLGILARGEFDRQQKLIFTTFFVTLCFLKNNLLLTINDR